MSLRCFFTSQIKDKIKYQQDTEFTSGSEGWEEETEQKYRTQPAAHFKREGLQVEDLTFIWRKLEMEITK